jgi:hypothetical protein
MKCGELEGRWKPSQADKAISLAEIMPKAK